ncbi:hypothetical protein [Streptomyces sp. NPDC051561]|uniref:hypothetical protein n=1 Tax=Streptomyces sp. NPDC051561 TaxID=3365658 RepID=UPI003795265B
MFEILPGRGLVLPLGAGTLTFGMAERDAQWAVATLCDVREAWVCGLEWSFGATYQGLDLLVGGVRAGGLGTVHLERATGLPDAPAAVPVVLDGVDVLGYPQEEVLEALEALEGQLRCPEVKLWPSDPPGRYPAAVHLSAGAAR